MIYRQAGQFRTTYAEDSRALPLREDRVAMAFLLVVAFVVIPLTASDYWLSAILIPWLALALVAQGQNILMGYAGQLSLGSAGFMAAGAFACYNLILRVDGMPFLVALMLSGADRRGDRHRLRPAQPARARPLPRGGDAGLAVLHRLGDRQVRLVQELRHLRHHHHPAHGDLRLRVHHAGRRCTWSCWASSRC